MHKKVATGSYFVNSWIFPVLLARADEVVE